MDPGAQIRAIVATSILTYTAFAGSRVAISLGALSLSASTTQIGIILSMYSVLPMLLSIASGRFIDRIGPRIPMLLGAICTGAGVAIPFFAFDVVAMGAVSVCIGLAFMLFNLCLHCLGGEIGAGVQTQRNFSVIAVGFSISAALGPMLAGFLIDSIGQRATFGVLALAPLIAFFTLLGLPLRQGRHMLATVQQPASTATVGAGALQLLRIGELRRLYIAVAMISSAWDVHQFLVPLYGAELGLSASSIGLTLAAFAAATFVVRSLLSIAGHRVGEWQVIRAAIVTGVLVLGAYPFFPRLPVMIAMSFVLGLGIGAAQPMMLSLLYRTAPAGRVGEAAGLRLSLVNATQSTLPMAFGALGAAFGLGSLFWAMAAVLGAGGLMTRAGALRR